MSKAPYPETTDSSQTPQPEIPSPTKYNKIFETLVSLDADGVGDTTTDHVVGFIAYGIYKQMKREWFARYRRDHPGQRPSQAEIDAWSAAQMGSTQIKGLLKQARLILEAAQDAAVAEATPQIEKDTLRQAFWPSVRASMIATFLYTVLLILSSFLLAFVGIDLLSVFEKVREIAG